MVLCNNGAKAKLMRFHLAFSGDLYYFLLLEIVSFVIPANAGIHFEVYSLEATPCTRVNTRNRWVQAEGTEKTI